MRTRDRRWHGDDQGVVAGRGDGRSASEHAEIRHAAQYHEGQEEAADQADAQGPRRGHLAAPGRDQGGRAAQATGRRQGRLRRGARRSHQEARRHLID